VQTGVNNKAESLAVNARVRPSFWHRPDHSAVVKQVWADIQAHDSIDLAAQMSFYFVLALFPFLLLIAAIVGWLPSTRVWQDFVQWIVTYLPRDSRKLIFAQILDLTRGYTSFFSIGLLATLSSASSGFVALMDSLNVAYEVKETRGFWRRRLIAVIATCVSALFFIASFGVLAIGHWLAARVSVGMGGGSVSHVVFQTVRWVANLLLMILALDLINHFLPNLRVRWRWVTRGRLFVALTGVVAFIAFDIYLRYFASYPRVYGALAGFIILLLWIYVASLILLIGAETDHTLLRFEAADKSA
jgi:membrane protein